MRQVNTSGSVLVCHEAGRNIGPNEEIDHPILIAGCEPAQADPKADESGPPPGDDAKPAGKAAKRAQDKEAGE